MCRVSNHAVQRYQERIERLPASKVRARIKLSSGFIDRAVAFGCGTVILGDGTRLKMVGDLVATVLEKRGAQRPVLRTQTG